MPTKTRDVTFVSRYRNLTLVRKPEIDEYISGVGRKVVQRPLRYEFRDGRLTVAPGRDTHQDSVDWLAPGEDQDAERDVVEALKAHRSFGRDFWLDGHAPGTLYPRPQDMRRDLKLAIAQLNDGAVHEMLQKERASHNRADLIEECEDALTVIGEALAAIEEHKAQQEAPAKGTPKSKEA